jgi:hypothetical protein
MALRPDPLAPDADGQVLKNYGSATVREIVLVGMDRGPPLSFGGWDKERRGKKPKHR